MLPLCLNLFARCIIGADQQITDDGVLCIAKRRNRHNCRESAAILADLRQLVDVFDTSRCLKDQCIKARHNRNSKFSAQQLGTRHKLLRVGNVGRCDRVYHLSGRVAQHVLRADVEDLDDALRVGGNTRKIGAVEDCALQGFSLYWHLFCMPVRRSDGGFVQVRLLWANNSVLRFIDFPLFRRCCRTKPAIPLWARELCVDP